MNRFLWLVLAACSMVIPAQANEQSNHFQHIRLQGFLLMNNVLAFYNPNGEGMDYRFQERYQQALVRLEEVVPPEGKMREALAQIREKLTDLDSKASETPEYLYSHWVNPMLKAHAELDALAAAQYRQSSPPEALARRHALNLDLSRLLLLYQTRTFGTLGVFVMVMEEDTFSRLDSSIESGFAELMAAHPELEEAVARLNSHYEFVRPRLMEHGKKWVPGITAYYMGNISRDLAGLPL